MLYPEAATADDPQYCAPRLEDGYKVEAVRRRIELRAGLLRAAEGPRIGALRGYVDLVSPGCIAGWAQNADHPEAPVCLDIFADGRLIGQTLANRYREDLARAGLGSGRHGFEFRLPRGFTARRSDGRSASFARRPQAVQLFTRPPGRLNVRHYRQLLPVTAEKIVTFSLTVVTV